MRKSFRISFIATVLGVVAVAGYLASIGASLYALRELKVGGHVYERVVLIKDLVADILPPPEYVIEAYLEATLLQQDPSSLPARKARLAQLHKDYSDRQDYWAKQEMDAGVKKLLTHDSAEHAERFWTAVESEMIPAMGRGEVAAARSAYDSARSAYDAHRAVIDTLVAESARLTSQTETYSSDRAGFLQGLTWIVAVVVLVIIAGSAVALKVGLLHPLTHMTRAMDQLAAGRLDLNIPCADRSDEIGDMASALGVFKRNGQQMQDLRRDQDAAASRSQTERKQALRAMADQFESSVLAIVQTVAEAAKDMENTATIMSSAVTQVNSQANVMAISAETASSNVQMVSAAAEELSSSISEISRQVTVAAQVSEDAIGETQNANARVESLANAANQIDNVVQLISDIADQTNLLALNASIEAARAGEAGKGFAVVAAEVKALAKQTAKATDDIGAQLSAVKGGTSQVVNAIENVNNVILRVREISTGISGAVTQQGAATAEIARNVQEAARGAQQVSDNIGGVTEAASTTGNSAVSMLNAAKGLSRNAAQLQNDAATFLAGVRAA